MKTGIELSQKSEQRRGEGLGSERETGGMEKKRKDTERGVRMENSVGV